MKSQWDPDKSVERAVRRYAALLWLYPSGFRRDYGPAMLEAFRAMTADRLERADGPALGDPWQIVLAELIPTLLREHRDAILIGSRNLPSAQWPRAAGHAARILLAAAIPLAVYIWLLSRTTRPDEMLASTTWLLGVCGGLWLARGRGRRCHGWTVLGATVGGGIPIGAMMIWTAVEPTVLAFVCVTAVAGVLALIISTLVRLVVEGMTLFPVPKPALFAR